MMKRLVVILFILGLLAGVAALVAPSFMNWDKHRQKIEQWLTRVLGVEVAIAGHVDFSVLPRVALIAHDITVGGFLKMEQAELELPIGPLLEGRIDISRIHVVAPVLDVARLSGVDWKGFGTQGHTIALGPITADKISLEYVLVEGGQIVNNGNDTGIDRLRMTVRAQTLKGPYDADGELMVNGDIPASFEMTTGTLAAGQPLTVSVKFTPGLDLPAVKFNGVADFSGKGEIQGELQAEGGSLVRFYDFLSFGFDAPFLRDEFSARGQVLADRSHVEFSGLHLDFPGTKIEGKAGLFLQDNVRPHVTVALKADHSAFTGVEGMGALHLPSGFDIDADLSVDELTLGASRYSHASFLGTADGKVLTIKSAGASTRLGDRFDVAGTYTPADKRLSVLVQAVFKDLPAFARSNEANDVLLFLSGQMPTLSGQARLDKNPDGFVLSEISGNWGDKDKVTGDMSSDASGGKLALVLTTLDVTSLVAQTGDAEHKFRNLIVQASGHQSFFDIAVAHVRIADVNAANLRLKGDSGAGGIRLGELSVELPHSSALSLNGKAEKAEPLAGLELTAQVKTSNYAALAKKLDFLGLPEVEGATAASIDMHLTGDAGNLLYAIKAGTEKSALSLNGNRVQTEQGHVHFHGDVDFSDDQGLRHALGLFGMTPVSTFRDVGKVSFQSGFDRDNGGLSLSGIRASIGGLALGGKSFLASDGNRMTAELEVDTVKLADMIDFSTFALPQSMRIDATLSAKAMAWHEMMFDQPKLTLSYTPDVFEIKSMDAGLWDGRFSLYGKLRHRGEGVAGWELEAHGRNQGHDGGSLLKMAGISGLELGKTDVIFDVSAHGNSWNDLLSTLTGTAEMTSESGHFAHFSPSAVPQALASWDRIAAHLPDRVMQAIRGGPGDFTALSVKAALNKGEIGMDPLSFQFNDGRVDGSGHARLDKRSYEIMSFISLVNPESIPSFGLIVQGGFDGDAVAAVSDIKPLEDFAMARHEGALHDQLRDQIEQRDENDTNVVNDILERLEKDKADSVAPEKGEGAVEEPIGGAAPAVVAPVYGPVRP